jgi:pyruvate,orthophosphate dikinase
VEEFKIQSFGLGKPVEETSSEVLGGKGAGLVWMDQQGVSVPPGFILPTSLWAEYNKKPKTTMKLVEKEIQPWLEALRQHFGYMPLLSVRSGSRVSCPGMMDTLLNVGIDTNTSKLWKDKLGEECYTNSRHRLVTMYGSVVNGLDRKALESLPMEEAFAFHQQSTGSPFPMAKAQVVNSIEAVFKSWNNERAVFYRKMNNIPDEWGTACVVQAMVFGNLNDQSGTGVLFTRDPDTGDGKILGEFMVNAQGEDVVAGIKTPMKLAAMSDWNDALYLELQATVLKLETLKKDVQDIEFTIQDGKLFILQTRNAKRSSRAALKIALDLLEDGIITPDVAIKRVSARDVDLAQRPVVDPQFKAPAYMTGIPACSGVAKGRMVFSSEAAISCKHPCILVTDETTPDDIAGMDAAVAVVTMTGGATSHAAVVARSMNKPCIVGVGAPLQVFKDLSMTPGISLTIDGMSGQIWTEDVPVVGCDLELLRRFWRLLEQVKGFSPVINKPPITPMDSAWLVVGETQLDPVALAKMVKDTASKVKTLYVDLASLTEDQTALITQLGGVDQQAVTTALYGLGLSNVKYYGLSSPVLPGIGSTTNLEALVMAQGVAVVDGAGTTPAMDKVLEWKKQEGIELLVLGAIKSGCRAFLSYEQAMAG